MRADSRPVHEGKARSGHHIARLTREWCTNTYEQKHFLTSSCYAEQRNQMWDLYTIFDVVTIQNPSSDDVALTHIPLYPVAVNSLPREQRVVDERRAKILNERGLEFEKMCIS